MRYSVGKLANEISKSLEITQTKAWDVLNELGYEPQELDRKQVAKWELKVARIVFNQQK